MLPPMKASGLLLSSATSIWSSEMLAGLFCAAILPAVSPGLTVTCCALDAGLAGRAALAGLGARAGGAGGVGLAAGAARGAACAAEATGGGDEG